MTAWGRLDALTRFFAYVWAAFTLQDLIFDSWEWAVFSAVCGVVFCMWVRRGYHKMMDEYWEQFTTDEDEDIRRDPFLGMSVISAVLHLPVPYFIWSFSWIIYKFREARKKGFAGKRDDLSEEDYEEFYTSMPWPMRDALDKIEGNREL